MDIVHKLWIRYFDVSLVNCIQCFDDISESSCCFKIRWVLSSGKRDPKKFCHGGAADDEAENDATTLTTLNNTDSRTIIILFPS